MKEFSNSLREFKYITSLKLKLIYLNEVGAYYVQEALE